MIVRFLDRSARGAAIAWGIWTPRAAFAVGILWWLCGYWMPLVPMGMALCTWVAIVIDRPIQRRLVAALEADRSKEASHA